MVRGMLRARVLGEREAAQQLEMALVKECRWDRQLVHLMVKLRWVQLFFDAYCTSLWLICSEYGTSH